VFLSLFRRALLKGKKLLEWLVRRTVRFLPKKVKQEIKRFFKLNLKWLQIAHKFDEPINAEQKATIILPLLEKAMMVIKALGGNQFFDQATTAMN
jgi:TetR/AcrR family transcriptional repressor of nem operon